MGAADLQEQLRHLTGENSRLLEEKQHLSTRALYLEGRVSHLSASNTHLASKLGQVEAHKLQVSRELVEEKLQQNAMRELWEGERFTLRNQVLDQEVVVAQLEEERDELRRELQFLLSRLQVAEESRAALPEEHNKRSCEVAPCRHLQEQQLSTLEGELQRISTLISTLSLPRVRPEDLSALEQQHRSMERSLLVSQQEVRGMVEAMRREHENQRLRLEDRALVMGEEQQKQREAIQRIQQRLSAEAFPSTSSEHQLVELEKDNSRLQLQVKHLNGEYRARLVCYLHDLADCMDRPEVDGKGGGGGGGGGSGEEGQGGKSKRKMFAFVEDMLQEIRSSYSSREEQLATAARSYKKKLQRLSRSHQHLLTADRAQREPTLGRPESGPDPVALGGQFSPEVPEGPKPGQRRGAREPASAQGIPGQTSEEAKANIEEHQKEINPSVLEVYEKERAQLITRATVAEGQVSELQQYIDNHLGRLLPPPPGTNRRSPG
ncbi:coiled-coil domain-containing protein 78 isoform X2 [Gadus macrocephalus]|uniref:coiled-coil domain-containing protein 78 isoform X2 n=1 Tax=Gadus macrocephalus TaxID=80720 RepID=UPI0028CB4798|nr:coiled-coil domain-containing protein 78 isoform X2 [Gadus macrocephalus]